MSGVIAIDPGKRSGWARFWRGDLREAGALPEGHILRIPPGPRSAAPGVCVIEVPVIYPGTRDKNPNDLITLALMVGDLRGYYRRAGFEVHLVKPRTWKGTAPKKICCARTVAALRPEELALLPKRPRAKDYDHNMLDSIGLGLWWLKKEGKRT